MTKTTIRMRVKKTGRQYLGECMDYPVMTHGRSLDDLAKNMEKAIKLFLSQDKMPEDAPVITAKVAVTTKGA